MKLRKPACNLWSCPKTTVIRRRLDPLRESCQSIGGEDCRLCSCRQRLHRCRRYDYLQVLPPVQRAARQTRHDTIEANIATERTLRAARRQRRTIGRRTVIKLAPVVKGLHRGGGLLEAAVE